MPRLGILEVNPNPNPNPSPQQVGLQSYNAPSILEVCMGMGISRIPWDPWEWE